MYSLKPKDFFVTVYQFNSYIFNFNLYLKLTTNNANNRTKRRWMPNLQRVKVKTDDGTKRVRVCTRCIRSGRIQKAA